MVTISSFWFMLLIEMLVATTVVSVLFVTFSILRRMRDRKAASQLIQRVLEDESRRAAETRKIMVHKFGFGDEDAEKITAKISHQEKSLYQTIINMYLRRDADELDSLNIVFEGTVESYRTLEPPGKVSSSGGSAAAAKELRLIKEENKRLTEDIGATMQTMGRMLTEYSELFAKDAEAGDGVEQIAATPEEEIVADAEESMEETSDVADEELEEQTEDMIGGMDDMSDLDPEEDEDLKGIEAPDNPEELLG